MESNNNVTILAVAIAGLFSALWRLSASSRTGKPPQCLKEKFGKLVQNLLITDT